MSSTLLLGGAGFIGLQIADRLSQDMNSTVHICDSLFRTTGEVDRALSMLLERGNVRLTKIDLTIPEMFSQLDKTYDKVYMLASVVGVDYANSVPHELIRINTAMVYNTLEWLRKAKPGKALFTSTSECYAGAIEKFGYVIPTPESVPLCITEIGHPRFSYAVTKMLGEAGFLNYATAGFFETSVVRYHNVYGPRMGFKHVIPHVVQRLLDGETPFKIYGHDQTRSFNFIDDAVAGTIAAMDNGSNGEIYHIGASDEITIEELVRYIAEVMEMTPDFENAETFPGSVSRRCPDISKARSELNYNPEVTWKDGVRKTVEWYVDYIKTGGKQYESYQSKSGTLSTS